ncbi:MAG: PVC-type heme-binding CxxCH protein, partial [Limisphaerales bacterium]
TNRRLHLSGIAEWREDQRIRQRKVITTQTHLAAAPRFNNDYAKRIGELKPLLQRSSKELKGRTKANLKKLPSDYSVSVWFRNDEPNRSRPVTCYFFSRGPDGDRTCPGDHLGIGGSYRDSRPGHLFVYNGNKLSQVALGKSVIAERTWNHVVMIREGARVRAYLNGKLEIDAELKRSIDASETEVFFGGRNDNFSILNGHLDQAAVFARALTTKEARALYESAGVKAPTKSGVASIVPLESEALSPSDGLRSIRVRDGYTVELVAAEPMVRDPVAIDWGADGRLWVVEMADYPNGMDDQGKPGGRIRVLSDEDRDGHYEKSQLFLGGLNFPTGVLAWKNGVLITAAPEIIYAEDTDGDGKADTKKVMYAGFNEGNQQLRVNGLRWGLDGWIYCASGSHHAGYGAKTVIKSHTGKKFDLGSRDFKIKPETGELIPLSGPSQFGRSRDDLGNWFGVQNSYPIWHYVIEDEYLQRNPYVTYPSPKKLLTERNPKVYPAKQPQKRFHNFTQSGRFTSACSVEIYRDEFLFGRTNTHAFTCEPFHNLVQHHLLTPDGVSFKHSRDPAEKELDFFTSTDRWCRPVQVRTGPDGALWVVDMYRYMIEHPQWLPPNGKEELRPHYRAGEERGRIFRIHLTGKRPKFDPSRRDAARVREPVPVALSEQATSVNDPRQRLQIALRLGNSNQPAAAELLADFANGDLRDPYQKAAVLSSTLKHFDVVVRSAVERAGLNHSLFPELLRMEWKMKKPAVAMNALLKADHSRRQFELIAAFLDDVARERGKTQELIRRLGAPLDAARKVATDPKGTGAERQTSLTLLGRQPAKRDADVKLLQQLIRPVNPAALQQAAITALLRLQAHTEIARSWRTLSPSIRQSAIDGLLGRTSSAKALIGQIKDGQIAVSDLSAAQRQRLTKHRDKPLRQLALATLKTSRNPDRQAVLKKFQPALKLKGDAAKGRLVFEKACHVCHRTDQAQPVGPDLRSITDKSPAGLLTAILDPNQSVDPRYTTYNIDLKDDTSLTGRIVSESGNSLTLLTAEAKRHNILRSQIAEVLAGRLSLMPEGLEAGFSSQQLADLIEFVRLMN